MKKSDFLFFVLCLILPAFTGFSQSLIPKSELPASRFEVEATVMDNDTWCRLLWPGIYNYDELAYDDGEADDYFIFSTPGGINANKFTPLWYPAEITGGEIYVGNSSFPGPFLGTQFRAMIFDDDGPNGLPGTVLDSLDVTVENYYWVEFEGMSAIINSGNFYLGMKQLASSPDAAPIGVDTDNPTYNKSCSYLVGPGWVTSPLQDFMIRAWVANGNINEDVDFYQVDRFSGFDPNGSPLLGDTTFLGNVTNPVYNDHDWAPLPMGWYAYGVKEHYVGGGWSDYNLSNLAGHMTSFTISINISLCDTSCWESMVVKVDGEEVPAELTPGGAYVTLEFNSPFPVDIDIEVYSPGNDPYQMNNVFISPDEVINIFLSCTHYPVRNLSVDPVSLIVTWDPPQVVPLEQNFESGYFPPVPWQMQSQGSGWFKTEDGSGGGWNIPGWNSNYACTNDLLSNGNDGSMDYLITPANKLDYRWDYKLHFHSYFDGFNNQDAHIEYSIDGGEWAVLYEMDPSEAWESMELDLSGFSGPEGPPEISFGFHADDNGQNGSGWAVDNIRIYSPDPPYTLEGYWVFVNDSLVAVTDTNFIDLSPLTYGESYTIKVKALYPSGLSAPVTDTVFCEYLYPPSCFYQENNMLLIACPPLDTNGNIPQNLIGLRLYRNMEFWNDISFVPEPPPFPIEIDISDLGPGIYLFGLTAVYDLSSYGFPGETGESPALTTEVVIAYGYPLPFLEQWNLGTFGTNNWQPEGENWSLTGQEGNPIPSAQFTWDPIQTDYFIALESYPLLADSLTEGSIYLDFDLKLDNFSPTGNEQMLVQIWNWDSQEWSTVSTYSNIDGSFSWMSEHLDITDQAIETVFKIRFLASGENSLHILGWYVDNIHVYRDCNPPLELEAFLNYNPFGMHLDWEAPDGTTSDQWIEWDDGVSSSAVGVGSAMPFDVAARWDPEQLSEFENDSITQIAFVPNEESVIYSVRVWSGELAETLLADQEVNSPAIGEWNTINLITPVPIDIEQDLWIGYQIDGPNGYQMGVDDGPAIDGYGNMLKFGPTWWTLLEINPDIDCNWNIAAYVKHDIADDILVKYAIYRSDNSMPYYLRDYTDQTYYLDDSAICDPGLTHFYKITALYINEDDTCESGFSNEEGDICEGIGDAGEEAFLKVYPNPASEVLFIESSERVESVSIFDSRGCQVVGWSGGQVVGWSGGQGKVEILVSDLVPGLYLVKVDHGDEIISRKIIVKH